MAARLALPLVLLLIGAAPAGATRTLYFGQAEGADRWCGYASKVARDAALKDAVGSEAANVTFAGGRVSRLVDQISPQSGDWVVTDTYLFPGSLVRVERAIGIAQGDIRAIKRGAARRGRLIRLSLVSARYPDGRRANPGDYYDPDPEVISDVDSLPFVGLGKAMLRRGIAKLCAPVSAATR